MLYSSYLFPKLALSESKEFVSVMTFNVLFINQEYKEIADIILSYQPDFVALQEVQSEMMASLRMNLNEMYPYSMIGPENPYGTTAVFSKHPFTESYILDLEADRDAVVVKAEVEGQEVTFISAHLLSYTGLWWVDLNDWPEVINAWTVAQNQQAQIIIDEVLKQNGIVIVGCDCNSKETSNSY